MNLPTVVSLSAAEIERARVIAKRWFSQQQKAFGGHDRAGVTRRKYERVLLGVLGEMAVAIHLGIRWDGATPFASTDVGPYQVRTHRREDSPLHLQQHANPDDLYILATVIPSGGRKITQINIVGWITVREARQQRWWTEPSWRTPEREPCWRIPQNYLHPIEELPEWPTPSSSNSKTQKNSTPSDGSSASPSSTNQENATSSTMTST